MPIGRFVFWFSSGFIVLMIIIAITGGFIAPYEPNGMLFPILQGPSSTNWFGTDNLGRDVFSRTIIGVRISIAAGFGSVLFAVCVGSVLGLVASYIPALEAILMRIVDALWAFPTVLLAMSIAITMTPGLGLVIMVMGVVYTPVFARLVFGQSVSVREELFVVAAEAVGCSQKRLLFRHILPNVAAPIIVQGTLTAGTAIVLESSLSFLGVGIQPPTPSWGVMIRTGYKWLERAPWMAIFPGLAIYLTVVSLNIIGDRLRIKLDPKQKRKIEI